VVGRVVFVHADGRFALALDDGREATGRAADARLMRLARHLGQRMLVLGTGTKTAIEADGVLTPDGAFKVHDGRADFPTESEDAELLEQYQEKRPGGATPEPTDHLIDAYLRNDR
jgi:hypothetical protein